MDRTVENREITTKLKKIWNVNREFFEVCGGARACVVREGPMDDEKVILLHGNLSWTFMHRSVRCLSLFDRVLVDNGGE